MSSAEDLIVVDALFDSLTRWDSQLQPRPAAAVRWQGLDGGRRWRFTLRRNATFHDGTAVTADSFVAAWDALARRGAGRHHLRGVRGYSAVRRGKPGTLAGVEAVNRRTFEVSLRRPDWEFPAVAAHPALGPLPAAASEPSYAERPIGNGVFRMAEPWARGRFVRLTRHVPPRQPVGDEGVLLDEVVFRTQDTPGAYLAYEQGRLDVATLPVGALSAAEPPPEPTKVYEGPGLLRGRLASTYFLVFNTRRPPFDDVGVRRAVSVALDRRKLVREVFEDNAGLGQTVVPPMIPGARERTCRRCVHLPDTAKTALAEAQVRRLNLWVSQSGDHEQVAREVRSDLNAVGLRVRVRTLPFPQFLRALREGRPGLFRFGWTLDYPTMANALRPLFHSESTPRSGGANVGRYFDPEVDALLDAASASPDAERRTTLLRRVEDIVLERDQAIIPVVVLRRRTVVSERVRGLTYGPLGTADLGKVRLVDRPDSATG